MEKFMSKLEKMIFPVAEKITSIMYLQAVAETMQVILPIIMIGSFACLFAFIDIGPWQAFLTANPTVKMIFMNTQSWTLSCLALYVALILPYLYAVRLEMKEAINMVPLTIAAFLLVTPTELYTAIPTTWLIQACTRTKQRMPYHFGEKGLCI